MNVFVKKFYWDLILFALIILAVLWAANLSPYFLNAVNLLNSAQFFVIFALMAFGLFPIVVQGEIDISLASTLAVGSVLFAKFAVSGMNVAVAFIVVLAIGSVLGAVNGVLVAYSKLPSMAVTLGTMGAYRGVAYIFAGDAGYSGIPPEYTAFGHTWIGIVPISVLVIPVVAIAFWFLMSHTAFGRYTYAIGNSEPASRMAGVPVVRIRVTAYVIAGALSALAGVIWVTQYQSARGDNADGTILFVLTTVVLGGVSIKGGSGQSSGVFLALVLLATLQTGMQLANIPGTTQTLVTGGLLILGLGIPAAYQLIKNYRQARTDSQENHGRHKRVQPEAA